MPVSQTEDRADAPAAPQEAAAFGVYIHWPFCKAKCPYCDFNSHVRENIDSARWAAAYRRAIADWAARTGRRRVDTVFFGGGTPSLMPPGVVEAVIDAMADHWDLAADAEITLEANPTSVEAGNFAGYAAAGVNRVSLGLQALDDAALGFLGRQHCVAESRAALATAQRHFSRVSTDFIYARPGQTVDDWRAELGRVLDLGTAHLSLYQLTIEPGTPFAESYRRGGLAVLSEDEAADLFEVTQEMTAAAGLPAYEISNHARPGQEARHNLVYWRYRDYAGIGPGAHGRIGGEDGIRATAEYRSPESWLAAVEESGSGLAHETALTSRECAEEALMMGLRLAEGVDAQRFAARTGLSLDAMLDPEAVTTLTEAGLIRRSGSCLAVTESGRPLLNTIIRELLR